MASRIASALPAKHGDALLLFLGIEVVSVAGFLGALGLGMTGLAAGFLLGPLQVLAWLVLLRDSYLVLIFFTAMLPLAAGEFLPQIYQRFVFYPGTVLIIVGLLTTRFVYKDGSAPKTLGGLERALLVVLSAIVAVSGVNAVLRGWGSPHLFIYTLFTLEVLAITYFFAVVPPTLQDVRVLLYVIIGMTVLAVAGVASLPSPVNEGGILGGKVVHAPAGALNLNTFGCVMAVVAAMIVGMLVDERRNLNRLFMGLALVPILTMLVLTKSRGAWLGFGLSFLYLLLRSRSPWLLIVAAGACAVLLLSDAMRETLLVRASQTSVRDPSLLGRLVLWKYAWDVGRDNWLLGVGMENFRVLKHDYGFPEPRWYALRYNAHSLYLELFADLGVPGVLACVWLMLLSFLRSFRLTGSASPHVRGPALALGAGLIAYAVHGLVDAFTYQHGTLALLGVLVGLPFCLHRLGSGAEAYGPSVRSHQHRLTAVPRRVD